MKVTDYIKQSEDTIFSFEIIPPLKGKGIEDICAGIDPLMEFKPPFINVTYHREEYEYKKMGNGLLKKVSIKKRPGTVGICAALMNRYKVDAIPHIICGGFSKEETESALIDLKFLGVDNILALRGDPMKNESSFVKLFFSVYSNFHFFFEFSKIFFPFLPIKKIKFLYLEKFSYTKSNTTGIGLNALDIIVPVSKFFISKIFC